jgi:exosortase D (VPLPA-CTERM-specific)
MEVKNRSLPLVPLLLGGLLGLALLWFYGPVLYNLLISLAHDEDHSFGLLLPVVSAYLVYLKWPQIRRAPWRPSWWGLAIMVLGFSLYLVGELAADLFIPRLSFILVLTGVLGLVGGVKIIRLLGFPLVLLVLMIPLPAMVTKSLTLPLQLMSSRLAAAFLRALDVPLTLHGNVIDLGVRQVQVVAACSGLGYILALLALGIIFCYFCQRRPWKAAILLISLIPAAIIANALRVAAMGIFPSLQQRFWHSFSGWLIFLLCFGFLGLLNRMLNYLGAPRPAPTPAVAVTPGTPAAPGHNAPPSYLPYLISALALTLAVGPVVMRLGHASPTPVLQSFDNFPMQLGAWEGHWAPIAPKMVRATGASAHLNAEFRNGQEGLVTLWIAFYESQKKSRGSIHSPQYCLPGSGWQTLAAGIRYVKPGLPVRYMLMEQAGTRLMVYYWYIQRGRWVASEYARKLFMGYDGLVSRRNDCALIRLITPVGHDLATARARLTSFARLLVPVLPQFIPD